MVRHTPACPAMPAAQLRCATPPPLARSSGGIGADAWLATCADACPPCAAGLAAGDRAVAPAPRPAPLAALPDQRARAVRRRRRHGDLRMGNQACGCAMAAGSALRGTPAELVAALSRVVWGAYLSMDAMRTCYCCTASCSRCRPRVGSRVLIGSVAVNTIGCCEHAIRNRLHPLR